MSLAETVSEDIETEDEAVSRHAFCTTCYPIDSPEIFSLCGIRKGGQLIGFSDGSELACPVCRTAVYCPRCGVKLARSRA